VCCICDGGDDVLIQEMDIKETGSRDWFLEPAALVVPSGGLAWPGLLKDDMWRWHLSPPQS